MIKLKNREHSVDVIFVLFLFLIFAMVLLSILFLGVKTYQNISSKSDANYATRTGLLYLSNKIKAYDKDGCISVGSFGDGDAIFLEEEIDGVAFVTKIYAYDGNLMELFMEKSNVLEPVTGVEIAEVKSLTIDLINDKLINISIQGEDCGIVSMAMNLH